MVDSIDLDCKNFNEIHDLWVLNSKYHSNKSMYFGEDQFVDRFSKRVAAWNNLEHIKLTVVKDKSIIGYCLSSIEKSIGTIESMFILEAYRKKGIGGKLVSEHIIWMKNNNCKRIQVSTVYENIEAIEFYKHMNIFPKSINLVLREK